MFFSSKPQWSPEFKSISLMISKLLYSQKRIRYVIPTWQQRRTTQTTSNETTHRQTSTANIVFGAKANVWRWITKLEKAEFNKSLTRLPTVERKNIEVSQGSALLSKNLSIRVSNGSTLNQWKKLIRSITASLHYFITVQGHNAGIFWKPVCNIHPHLGITCMCGVAISPSELHHLSRYDQFLTACMFVVARGVLKGSHIVALVLTCTLA